MGKTLFPNKKNKCHYMITKSTRYTSIHILEAKFFPSSGLDSKVKNKKPKTSNLENKLKNPETIIKDTCIKRTKSRKKKKGMEVYLLGLVWLPLV